MDYNYLKKYLSNNQVKPSNARIKIYQYLKDNRSHPTVDEIYNHLLKEMPTLSKTTVYNTLKLFTHNDMAQVISIEDNELRYDANVTPHGHFKCESCGKIYDFHIDSKDLTRDLSGYSIKEKHFYFKGICKDCNKNNN